MPPLIRRVLFWVLIIVLPVQSVMAGAVMRQPLKAAAHAFQAAGRGSAKLGLDHAHMSSSDCAGAVTHQETDASGTRVCALLAACGMVAVSMPAGDFVAPAAGHSAPVTAFVQPAISFCTSGPERPPRSLA